MVSSWLLCLTCLLFQLYCCQWLGKDSIVCGGTDKNMARVVDRGTLNVSA